MPENNPMVNRNSGEISDQEALNILEGFMSTLTDNLGSLTGQIKSLVTVLTKQSELDRKVTADLSKNIKTMDSNFKSIGKDFNTFGKSLEKINKDSDRTISELQRQKRNLSGSSRNIESLAIEKEIKIAEGHKKQLNALYEGVAAKRKELDHDKQLLENAKAAMESLSRQVELDGASNENLIKSLRRQTEIVENLDQKYNKSNESVQKSLDDMQSNIDRINKQTKELYEENEKAMAPLREVVAESQNAFRSLGSQSSIIAKFLNKEEGTEEERFQRVIDQTAESLEHALNKINGRLNEIGDGSSKEREDLEEQKRILEEQLKATKKLSPALEKTAKLLGDLKGSLGKTIQNITKNLLSTVESKYLDAYLTGFENVYQSIEGARNSISARLRMDQGEFSNLQQEITTLIEERGLSGSVSTVDTNEALTQLVASGVTDERILKEFSIMQAKLKAEGSSLNLTNEEMLTRTLSQINKEVSGGKSFDDAMAEMSAMFEATAQAEIYAREKYGQDIALVNGAEDQIVNMVTNIDTSLGKSTEDMTKDIQEAVVNAMSLQAAGIDPTAFLSQIQDLVNGKITDNSAMGAILRQYGNVSASGMQGMSFGDAYNAVVDAYQKAFQNTNIDYTADLQEIYGASMDVGDIRKLIDAISNGQGIKTTLSDSDYNAMAQIQTESNEALANATYMSETSSWMKQMENAATDEAIAAEKLYEGDKKYLAVVGGIYDGVKDIVDILTQYAFTGFSSGGFSAFGGTGTGGSAAFGNFMTGASGTKAGALGKGLGVATGVGIAGYSVVTNAIDAESFGEFAENTLRDQTFATGIGTALGSAIAGPVGGVVGGAIYGAANEFGNYLYDKITSGYADDGLMEASDALENSADALLESATKQYQDSYKEYTRLKKMHDDEDVVAQRQELLMNDNYDKSQIIYANDEEIQKLFKENLETQEQQLAEANIKGKTAQLIKENAQALENAKHEVFMDVDLGDGTFLEPNETTVSKFEGALGSSATELYSSLYASEGQSDEELRSTLIASGYSPESVIDMDRDKLEEEYRKSMVRSVSETAGFDEITRNVFEQAASSYNERKTAYESANKDFKVKWKNAIDATETGKQDDIGEVWKTYRKMHKGLLDNYPLIDRWSGNPEDVNLDQISSRYKDDYRTVGPISGLQGDKVEAPAFETGLTSVPFDSYPTYLHTGERVLTKEEARAYNELSSSAVEQLSSMSDISTYLNNVNGDTYEQVFNSEHLGTDKLNKSIETQTTSLEKKLDIVINALNTLIVALRPTGRSVREDANVIAMNSNISQLATAK